MALTLSSSYTAVAPNVTSSFLALGGVGAITYSVLPNGAGGTIDGSTGVYTAPSMASSSPKYTYDVIQAVDTTTPTPQVATTSILVGGVIPLFCDIIQREMNLSNDHIFEWNQKIFLPKDYDLYVIVSVMTCKPFGNTIYQLSGGTTTRQDVNMAAIFDIDILSRGPAARDQKEFVLMALNSTYSEQQQEANSFSIGRITKNFVNLSNIDGSAIPFRYKLSVQVQYTVSKIQSVPYFDTFTNPEISTNP